MKNLFVICIALFSLASYAQDRIAINDDVSHVVTINRMHYDTVFFTLDPGKQFFTYNQFKTLRSTDKFKIFLYKNPEVFKSDNIELQFTNYCLNRYRMQKNLGRGIMLSSAGIIGIGFASANGNIETMKIAGAIGVIAALTGLIVEWNSLHWIKNIQVTGSYQPGLGYVFKF